MDNEGDKACSEDKEVAGREDNASIKVDTEVVLEGTSVGSITAKANIKPKFLMGFFLRSRIITQQFVAKHIELQQM